MITVAQIHSDSAEKVYDLFNKYRIFYEQPSNPGLAKSFIDERLNNKQSIIYVAFEGERPVGFTQLYPAYSSVRVAKDWILNDLYVESDCRKKGVGNLLINKAIDFCKKDNARALHLETAQNNYTAKSLYDKMGFKIESVESQYDKYKLLIG